MGGGSAPIGPGDLDTLKVSPNSQPRRMNNRCQEPVRERVSEISGVTWRDRLIVKGCEYFHLMQLAVVLCR